MVEWHSGSLRFAVCWYPLRALGFGWRRDWAALYHLLGLTFKGDSESNVRQDMKNECSGFITTTRYTLRWLQVCFISISYIQNCSYPWRLPLCILAHQHRIIILQQGVRRENHACNVEVSRKCTGMFQILRF